MKLETIGFHYILINLGHLIWRLFVDVKMLRRISEKEMARHNELVLIKNIDVEREQAENWKKAYFGLAAELQKKEEPSKC